MAFYAPELLNNDQKSQFIELIQSRWKATGDDVKWNTIDKVVSDLSKMGAEFNSEVWKNFYKARMSNIGLSSDL